MKLNISFEKFKEHHKNKKNQIIFTVKKCKSYSKIENLFKFLLVEKNSFIFESVEKGKLRGRYTIIGLNPDKIWNIKGNTAEIKTIKQRLVDQIDNSVMFYDQILNIENIAKPEKWYHIGPGNVTAGMVKKSISSESIEIINSLDSLNNI